MERNQGQIVHIEAIRAIAALMVLAFHFISYHNGTSFLIASNSVRDWSSFGAQGVEMFYIISGFVMALSLSRKKYEWRNYGSYLLKRALRILPLYWTVILLILIIQLVWSINPDWNNFLANMTFSVDLFQGTSWLNPVFDTLGVEVQFYILFGLLFPIIQHNRWLKYALFLAWLVAGYYTQVEYSVLSCAPFFIIGILLNDIRSQGVLFDKLALLLVVSGLMVLELYQDVAIVVVTLVLFLGLKPTWRPLSYLGERSYSLYLTHGIFGGWLLYFLTAAPYGNMKSAWWILCATIVSILGAILVHRFVEVPSTHISKSIKMRK